MSRRNGLSGRSVLILRPRHQAGPLAKLIEAAGGEPLIFPVLEIEPLPASPALLDVFDRLREFRLAVFVSANAVRCAWPHIERAGGWPGSIRSAAIGPATARELVGRGVPSVLQPEDSADSEGLLALRELSDVRGWNVLIVRGSGGRELLSDELRRRGARVEYAECYRRVRSALQPASLHARLNSGRLNAICAASAAALQHLLDLLPPTPGSDLRTLPLFVPHERIRTSARDAGFTQVVVTPFGDSGLLEGMIDFFGARAQLDRNSRA
jgi:uroporphyrinogen-III synthase